MKGAPTPNTHKTKTRKEISFACKGITSVDAFKNLSEEKQTIILLSYCKELSRSEIEPIIRNNYFPNPSRRLRVKFGFDMKWWRYNYINDLGKPKWYAIWYLTPEDKERAREFVGEFI